MNPFDYTHIEQWTEEDLLDIPNAETDFYEYKSSLIRDASYYRNEMHDKIVKTASAFWNTGGGILIVGVDDSGVVDGGVPYMMGKQKIRDWVDVILTGVAPVGPYTVQTIKPKDADSKIDKGHVVLVIGFGESVDVPHMSPDNRYYVRAGAHSNPANHYLVEAIRARRGLRRPQLRALVRENPQKPGIVELVVLSINELPALNLQINFEPLPTHLQEAFPDRLPLIIPVVDRMNPFRLDLATVYRLDDWLGDVPFQVILQYEGVRGSRYEAHQPIDHHRSISPSMIRLGNGNSSEKMLSKIGKQLGRLNDLIEAYTILNPRNADPDT